MIEVRVPAISSDNTAILSEIPVGADVNVIRILGPVVWSAQTPVKRPEPSGFKRLNWRLSIHRKFGTECSAIAFDVGSLCVRKCTGNQPTRYATR